MNGFTRPRQIAIGLIDLLFPARCLVCQRAGGLLCDRCAQAVEPISGPLCARCGRRQQQPTHLCRSCQLLGDSPLQAVRAAALHTHPLRELIHAFKYEQHPELAPWLARYLLVAFQNSLASVINAPIDLVTPVPIHPDRLAERGYNQAELLARPFCQHTRLRLENGLLQRVRATAHQVGLSAAERQENVADAFRASHATQQKTVLLIDDVYTTGATLQACAQALVDAGARNVYALALASPAHVQHDDAPTA